MARPARAHARSITSILIEAGVVTPEQVDAGLMRQRSTGRRIGETLVELEAATEEDIGWALARQLAMPFVDPRPETLDRALIESFPEGLLHRLEAIPLMSDEQSLTVAVADPLDTDLVDELERAAGRSLTLCLAAPTAIRRVLRDILGPRPDPVPARPAPAPSAASDAHFDVQWERSGATFLNFHVGQARRAGATEVHFVPRSGSIDVQHRLGGRLAAAGSEPPNTLEYLLARIEALGGPTLEAGAIHDSGRVACPAGTETLELGVSLLREEDGVAVTLEILPAPSAPARLDGLGLDPLDLARLRGALDSPAGLGIVTGPPRSGGSTTLAGLLAEMKLIGRRCIALGAGSNPLGPSVARVPAPPAESARIWADIAVAQCADVVVLDEVLAGDAVSAALAPAAAGRWVMIRTDWTDSFALLERLAARTQDRMALADRLRFVVQQRLLRVDATAGPPAPGLRPDRIAVFEVLVLEDPLRDAIRAGEPAPRLRARAEADGFRPLPAAMRARVTAGEVSAAEAARALG